MASNPKAALAAAGGLVAAVVLFIVLQGGEEETTTTNVPVPKESTERESGNRRDQTPSKEPAQDPQSPTIVVEGGQPVDGVADLKFSAGDDIRFAVESDASDELHLHGYDVSKPIKPGQRVEFDVPATIEGVFELELEHSAVPLAEISVLPD